MNDDGQVNSVDALIMLTWAVGLPVPDPARVQVAGDVNADLLVNSVDALVALRFTVGLGTQGTRLGQPICTAAANVVVDPSRTFQTINGWEAAISGDPTWTPAFRDAIINAAVNDLGINRLRTQAFGGTSHATNAMESTDGLVATNDNSDPNVTNPAGFVWGKFDQRVLQWVLPMKQRVEARGEPFVMNVCYVGFHSSTSFHKIPAEYAEFVVTILKRLRANFGLEPDLWELSLEPDNNVTKTGTELGNMLKAAGDRARAEGFTRVMFAGPSVSDADNAVPRLQGMLAVPGARQYLSEATYHRYRGGATVANLNAIRDFAQANGLRTAQLEFIGADYKMLFEDLTEANVSAWQQFTLAFPAGSDDGAQLYLVNGNSFSLTDRAWYLRQYFRYIRPGAVRLGATSTDPAINPVAFRNRNGNVVVVAYTTKQATLTIAGLPAGTYQVSFTTATQRGANAAPVSVGAGGTVSTTIPAAGVITISR